MATDLGACLKPRHRYLNFSGCLTALGPTASVRVGVADETAGEVPTAFVVARDDLAADELMSWVADRVALHERIPAVELIEEIPKLPSGKILRRLLGARTHG